MDGNLICMSSVPQPLYEAYERLLTRCGLRDERDTQYTVLCLDDDGNILACGSRRGNVLKQIAVSPEAEAQGLCSGIITELATDAAAQGYTHLFLYTSREHEGIFSSLGFFRVIQTERILMMENRRDGLGKFLASLTKYSGRVGAVVCNCNPFTLGHRYLIEQAAARCDELLVFVLSEDASLFSAEERFALVQAGTADLANVHVLHSGDYIISYATFPTYFIKDSSACADAACELDIALFAQRIAPALNISMRFVGEEPYDRVTRDYNEKLKKALPAFGIELIELKRFRDISAGAVRKLIAEGRLGEAKGMLPPTTYGYCTGKFGRGSALS